MCRSRRGTNDETTQGRKPNYPVSFLRGAHPAVDSGQRSHAWMHPDMGGRETPSRGKDAMADAGRSIQPPKLGHPHRPPLFQNGVSADHRNPVQPQEETHPGAGLHGTVSGGGKPEPD